MYISPYQQFNNKMRKCGWWRSLPHTCYYVAVLISSKCEFVLVIFSERGWYITVCTSGIASAACGCGCPHGYFLLRRNRRQLYIIYIIDGCTWKWYDRSFSFISSVMYKSSTQYIDTKNILDRLDNFKCEICPFKYTLRCVLRM